MDACLYTLSDELCQVNTRVGHIVRRQAVMGGYTVMMMALQVMMRCLLDVLTPLSLVTKKRSSFEMKVVILIGGGLV